MKNITNIINDSQRIFTKTDIHSVYLSDGLKLEFGEADILILSKTTQEVASIM